tara:strand:- start:4982 stop:5383 length:402 start_codon:yes stop_codon:yes gene_type:complete
MTPKPKILELGGDHDMILASLPSDLTLEWTNVSHAYGYSDEDIYLPIDLEMAKAMRKFLDEFIEGEESKPDKSDKPTGLDEFKLNQPAGMEKASTRKMTCFCEKCLPDGYSKVAFIEGEEFDEMAKNVSPPAK